MDEKRLVEAVNGLETIVAELDVVNESNRKLQEKQSELEGQISRSEETIKSISDKLGSLIESSQKLENVVEIMETYIRRLTTISSQLDSQIEEARRAQNEMMMVKMDVLLSKMESFDQNHQKPSNKAQKPAQPKKEQK
ncbi:MAG: hypothetical protein MJ220_02855 [Bacilli bacterium]|nr:hypothetical protein [Bacilli bacterium]